MGDKLDQALENSELGMFDGDEFSDDGAILYLYSPDADLLFEAIKPILIAETFPEGSLAMLRYGPPNDASIKQTHIKL